jgi:hypothetical protein
LSLVVVLNLFLTDALAEEKKIPKPIGDGTEHSLPDAWQIALNPTFTYNSEASSGNHWNVPLGITVAKMTKIGKLPVKSPLGVEYAEESVSRKVKWPKKPNKHLAFVPPMFAGPCGGWSARFF